MIYIFKERLTIMKNYRFSKEDFSEIGKNVLVKVVIKPEYGLVRNRSNIDSNYVFGFVSEKSGYQYLTIEPRSWDDCISHMVWYDGEALEIDDNSVFQIWYGDIEWVYVEYRL